MNDSILVLWVEDFENGENYWSLDSGWELTESNTDNPSPTHSVLSPNSDNNQNGVYNLLTPALQLPQIGSDETMHFGFWLYADMPDHTQTDDSATEEDESDYVLYGGVGTIFGSFLMLISFDNIGNAGEELQKAGEKLEAEQPKENE